jgi:hypothetical protein
VRALCDLNNRCTDLAYTHLLLKLKFFRSESISNVSAMITCKLTGTIGKGVKAHIVPRAFYEIPPQGEGPYKLLTNIKGTFPKKLPVGIYDSAIVTKEGEKVFGPWDDYAVRILVNNISDFHEIRNKGEIIAWRLPRYEYSTMKLFALSILWRAHASNHPAFSRVKLGPHEGRIRDMLLNSQPGDPEQYSVHIVRWIDEEFGPVFMDPSAKKYEGVNYYRIYCEKYVIYIKIDRRKTIETFREVQLGSSEEMFIIARELKKSKEWSLMKKIAKQNAR